MDVAVGQVGIKDSFRFLQEFMEFWWVQAHFGQASGDITRMAKEIPGTVLGRDCCGSWDFAHSSFFFLVCWNGIALALELFFAFN